MERQNCTVEQIIRALIHEGVDDWVKAIPLIELCVNNPVADSTGVLQLPLLMASCCVCQWTTWMGCTTTKRHKPL